MIDQSLVLAAERLRDDLQELRNLLRTTYPSQDRQVTSGNIKRQAAQLAEVWLVDFATRADVSTAITAEYHSDLTLHFQRLLSYSEHATLRRKYDLEISPMLSGMTTGLVIRLKQAQQQRREVITQTSLQDSDVFSPTAFLGHSFATIDEPVITCFKEVLIALGLRVVSGQKPRAERISDKVKQLIQGQHIFVGLFTRRTKTERSEWTTSAWVIEEKAWALAHHKRLILLREDGIESIGGMQGDYEYIEFSRDELHKAIPSLLELFDVSIGGLKT